MELTFAFATDDGESLKGDDHFGNAKHYYIYKISPDKSDFMEQRDNIEVEENEEETHGDYKKAKAVSSVLEKTDVLVSKIFGPNIKRMKEKFVCIIVRVDSIKEAVDIMKRNMNKIVEEYQKGKERKHLVLTS